MDNNTIKADQVDAIVPLVRNVIRTKYEDIPQQARDVAKRTVIDTLGPIIAGSTAPGCQAVVNMAKDWGGKKESTVITGGIKVPAANAVWANAAMGRSRELDDAEEAVGDHSSVVAVPAALAMSEMLGGVSGKDAITAIVLGDDLVIRIRSACKRKSGVSPWGTGSYSVFNAAAIAGKLLGLNEEKMTNAMGLAYSQMSNTYQWVIEGALSGRVHQGIAVKAGIVSALLADKGITGPHNVLEGKYGLYPVYELGQYDRDAIFGGLGKDFRITGISVKPFASCKVTHSPVQGTLELVREHDIHAQDVKEIRVYVSQGSYNLCAIPEDAKKAPRSVADAQFSHYYNIAVAVVHQDVFIAQFTEEAIKSPEVLDISRKVKVIVDPELSKVAAANVPQRVEIETKAGRTYSRTVEYVVGHPKNPMSFDDCVEKLRKCLPYSIKPLRKENTEEVISLIRNLENLKDMGRIPRLLA
jgi:2-methylcitrate dehydratase PrpD